MIYFLSTTVEVFSPLKGRTWKRNENNNIGGLLYLKDSWNHLVYLDECWRKNLEKFQVEEGIKVLQNVHDRLELVA